MAAGLKVDWDARFDNHTHPLRVGELEVVGNAAAPDTILFDLAVLERLNRYDVELVGNSFGHGLVEAVNPAIAAQDLAHVLVIDDVPNYLSPNGPYHPVIEEARNDRFLKDFRRWVSDTAAETPATEPERIKHQVEQRLREAQEELFLAYLEPRSQYFSVGKAITGAVADLIVPWTGTIGTAVADIREARDLRHRRWQGFLVSFERTARGMRAEERRPET